MITTAMSFAVGFFLVVLLPLGHAHAEDLLTIDVAPIYLNIPDGNAYTANTSNFTMTPEATVKNLGTNAVGTFQVFLTVEPGGYSSNFTIPYLSPGFEFPVVFTDLNVVLGQPMTVTIYTTLVDSNRANDTIRRYTTFQPGAARNVLLEEWTSSTCVPCANNNPTVDAFIDQYWTSIVATKYHVGWPAPGNDPMYLHNPTQSYDRRYYYGVNSAPTVKMDGIVNPVYPYTTPGSLENAYNSRWASPLEISVVSTRPTLDSIRSEVTITTHSALASQSHYLRVQAVERHVHYASPPGTNGEADFLDVFRRSYPNSTGTLISNTVGTQTFTFQYKIDPVWKDTMIYTVAFVQNDVTKEVINAGKSNRTSYVLDVGVGDDHPTAFALHQNYPNPFNPSTTIRYTLISDGYVALRIYNTMGQEVRTLVNSRERAGLNEVTWDGLDDRGFRVGSGIYMYRLETGDRSLTRKMLLLK